MRGHVEQGRPKVRRDKVVPPGVVNISDSQGEYLNDCKLFWTGTL